MYIFTYAYILKYLYIQIYYIYMYRNDKLIIISLLSCIINLKSYKK